MTIRGPFAFILVILLIVSLAANFMILGFTAAQYRNAGNDGGAIERIVAIGAKAFPRELRGKIRSQLEPRRSEMRGALRDLRQARVEMFRAMAADPLDREKLDATFSDVRNSTNKLQRLGQKLVEDVLEKATPEERAKIRGPRRSSR